MPRQNSRGKIVTFRFNVDKGFKNGILVGRLHSAFTAAALGETPTGNARAMNFEYEPIVRMTTTYIGAGTQTKEGLIGAVEDGLYISDINHGSGMSTFTIAPRKAYRIRIF